MQKFGILFSVFGSFASLAIIAPTPALAAPTARLSVPTKYALQELGDWSSFENGTFWAPHPTQPRPDPTPATESCPAGMKHVQGYKLETDRVEALQSTYCTDAKRDGAWFRCDAFNRAGYTTAIERLKNSLPISGKTGARAGHQRYPMDFCMDEFEFPNQAGHAPVVAANWFDAEFFCASEGKRLCTSPEWTFACEGEDAWPSASPDWDVRHGALHGGCNVGANAEQDSFRPATEATPASLARFGVTWNGTVPLRTQLDRHTRASQGFAAILAHIYGAGPAGAATGCTSPFGVKDMTGNVDEWTAAPSARAQMDTVQASHRAGRTPRSVPRTAIRESVLLDDKALEQAPASTVHFGYVSEFNVRGRYASHLKGGWWGPVRNRCRPMTAEHGPSFSYYNVGFRCCKGSTH